MSWPIVPITDVARVVGGATPKSGTEKYWDGDILWTTPKDLTNLDGKFLSDTPRKITEEGLQSCSAEVLPANSVLFSSRAPIGHVAINSVPIATNQGFKSFVPNERIDASFLYWWLDANRSHLQSMGTGATFKEVSKAAVERIKIPLPPLEEQKRIAGILDQADALRRLRTRALDKLNSLGQAIFHEMFGDIGSSKLPTQNFGDFAEIKLGKMLDRGKFKGGETKPYLRNVNVRWFNIDTSDVFEMEFEKKEQERFRVLKGDLLICEGGEPGRCAIWTDDNAEIYYQKALHRVRLNQKIAVPDYIAFWFYIAAKTGKLSDFISTATIAHLTGAKIKQLPIMLPSIAAQHAFANRLKNIDGVRAATRNHLSAQDALFASLQQRAFRGEL